MIDFSNVIFNIPVTPALLKNISIEKELRFTLSFENAIFLKEVDFTDTVFIGETNFNQIIFEKEANFSEACFAGKVKFNEAIFDEKTYFNNVEFKNEAKFIKAEFKKEAKFNEAIFNEKTYFNNVEFKNEAKFIKAEFVKEINFNNTEFGKEAKFNESKFEKETNLEQIKFSGVANFNKTEFLGNTNFNLTEFSKRSVFFSAVIKKGFFNRVRFLGETDFAEVEFGKEVDFSRAEFLREVYFEKTKFLGTVNFNETKFIGQTTFNETKFSENFPSYFYDLKKKEWGKDSIPNLNFESVLFPSQFIFSNCDLQKTTFKECIIKNAQFLNCTFCKKGKGFFERNAFCSESEYKIKEKRTEKEFVQTKEDKKQLCRQMKTSLEDEKQLCRQMKTSLETSKNWKQRGDFYIGEMEARKEVLKPTCFRDLFTKDSGNWLGLCLYKWLFGYAEKISILIIWIAITFFATAVYVYFFGEESCSIIEAMKLSAELTIPPVSIKLGWPDLGKVWYIFPIIFSWTLWITLVVAIQRKLKS